MKISESMFFLLKYIKTLSNTGKSIEIPQLLSYIKVTIPKGDFFMNVKDISTHCTRTEFVGTTVLDTIGLVISGIDHTLLQKMNIGTKYYALGLFSSRTGAAVSSLPLMMLSKPPTPKFSPLSFPEIPRLGRTWKLYCTGRK